MSEGSCGWLRRCERISYRIRRCERLFDLDTRVVARPHHRSGRTAVVSDALAVLVQFGERDQQHQVVSTAVLFASRRQRSGTDGRIVFTRCLTGRAVGGHA